MYKIHLISPNYSSPHPQQWLSKSRPGSVALLKVFLLHSSPMSLRLFSLNNVWNFTFFFIGQKPSKQEQDRESGRPKTKALTKFAQVGATYWPSYSILQNIVSIKPETQMAASAEGIIILIVYICCCCISTGCPKKNEPVKQTKIAKHGRLVNIPKWFKRVQNGQPRCFWPFGTILGPYGHFGAFSDKNQVVAP